MADKKKFTQLTLKRGRAVWPHLHAPDTKFAEGGAGLYHTKVEYKLTDAGVQEAIEVIDAEIATFVAETQKAKGPKVKLKMSNPPYTVDEDAGTVVFHFKRNAAKKDGTPISPPLVYDSKGKKIMLTQVGGGSTISVSFSIMPFPNYTPTIGCGVKLGLEAFQIIELRQFGGPSADRFGFGEEDGGFEGDEGEASPFASDDTSPAPVGEVVNGSDF